MSDDGEKKESLILRVHRFLGPLAGGYILDAVDLASYGPLGIGGLFVGALAGWWVSFAYPTLSTRWRLLGALFAGVYCMTPFTEFVPLATIVAVISRLKRK